MQPKNGTRTDLTAGWNIVKTVAIVNIQDLDNRVN